MFQLLHPQRNLFAACIAFCLIFHPACLQSASGPRHSAPALLKTLFSPNTPDADWQAAARRFANLPPEEAITALFPVVAKGMPAGGIYNCYDPAGDRKIPRWGEYCVATWLWCEQLQCPHRRAQAAKVLLQLWPEAVSYNGRLVLLQGLCGDRDAERRIAALFTESAADSRLRTEAAVCLLNQDATRYHNDVVAFAQRNPPKIRQRLFTALASVSQPKGAAVDPAVVSMGFGLLLQEMDQRNSAGRRGQQISAYGQFLYANRLGIYTANPFTPDRKLPRYNGPDGMERWYRDTVSNALGWWSKHKQDYSE